MNATTMSEVLAQEGIRMPGGKPVPTGTTGSHKTICPRCEGGRGKEFCLSITVETDGVVWKCHRAKCGWTGGWKEPKHDRPANGGYRRAGAAAGRSPHAGASSRAGGPQRPAQAQLDATPEPQIPALGVLSTEMTNWFAKRGISEETLMWAHVQSCRRWVPGAGGNPKGAEVDCIAFPYKLPGGKVVNVKFRSSDKRFTQVKNGQKVLWGLERINLSEGDALVIVEGEIDALSVIESGWTNVVSVPDGAPEKLKDEVTEDDKKFSYLGNSADYLDGFKRIILAVDSDGPGTVLREELARRFGREKCWVVEWPEGIKDANEALLAYGPDYVRLAIEKAQPYPIAGIYRVADYADEVKRIYLHGRGRGLSTGWQALDRFYTVRGGEMTVVTGTPNEGKSEWVDALMMNLAVNHHWHHAVCSFENPPTEHLIKLAEKYAGMPFFEGPSPRMSHGDLDTTLAWLNERYHFLRAEDETPTLDWLLEKARAAVLRYGVKGMVIDPYNEIDHKRPAGMTETEYISHMLSEVKRFVQGHGVHLWFVAHPIKPRTDKDGNPQPVNLYDIAGSAHWVNKTDNGIVVRRIRDREHENAYQAEIQVKKIRFKAVGRPGNVTLDYDRLTGRYSEQAWAPEQEAGE